MNPFFMFILILFVLASFLRIDFFFTILYLVTGVFIVVRVWSDRIIKKLDIQRIFLDRAFIGDMIEVSVTITNGSRLPIPWLTVDESVHWHLATSSSLHQVVTLKGKDTRTFTYTLQARQRGYYTVGPTDVRTGDLLGMRYMTDRLEAGYLIVYPKIVPLAELGLPMYSPQAILPIPVPILEDPSRITGIREYRWGDNPRRIHWPATARTGRIMVKQFRPAIARETTIFLNLTRSDYVRPQQESALELAISAAASLAYHILTHEKLPVGLDTAAMDPLTREMQHFHLPAGKEQGRLLRILEVLARIQPVTGEADFLSDLRCQAIHLSWGATIVIITGRESDVLSETLLWLKSRGFHPVLVLMNQYLNSGRVPDRLFPSFALRQEEDIEAWGLKY
jgi:uncharacterized protein (DUF58 family)